MVTQHFGSVAASTVRGFVAEQFPLLIVGMRNRSAMEICSVLQGKKCLQGHIIISNGYLSTVFFNHLRVSLTGRAVAYVAWRFWLGALSNKGRRGQRNREEIGAGATLVFIFLAASPLVRQARQNRHATQASRAAVL